jgi:hypothetical protein
MSNYGGESTVPPNGYREPGLRDRTMQGDHVYGDVDPPKPQAAGADKAEGASKGQGIGLNQILNFAKDMQSKVKDIPYIVPIAAGAAGFVPGTLVSSRILRQIVLLAGGYAVKQAVAAAPKDEIFAFAKKVIVDAIESQRA